MKTTKEVAYGVVMTWLHKRQPGMDDDRGLLIDGIAAALEAYHLDCCRAALGESPVSGAKMEAIRELARLETPGLKDALKQADYYRDLSAALAIDTGCGDAYQRGMRAGIAKGKVRCVEAAVSTLYGPLGESGNPIDTARAVDTVSVEP